MIRFILLLPVKLLGLLFLGISEALKASEARRAEAERVRVAQAKQDERDRIRRERDAARATRAAQTNAARIQREAKQREAERLRAARAAERVREAQADLDHLEVMRGDLMRLANAAEAAWDAASTDAQRDAALRKRIAADQRIRSVDRQRERLQFVVNQGGR